jgi:hypothetical protein
VITRVGNHQIARAIAGQARRICELYVTVAACQQTDHI